MEQKMIFIGSILLLWTATVFAQESTNVAGGNAISSQGSVSYSVGQVIYVSNGNGSVMQGVQQTFDIKIITGTDDTSIQLGLSAYPNPTTDVLVLRTENVTTRTLTYQLLNANGTLLEQNKITSQETIINPQHLNATVYVLQIFENEKNIKTFKIIKQ